MARCVRFLLLLLVLAGCATAPDEQPQEFRAATAKPVYILPPAEIAPPKAIPPPAPAVTNLAVTVPSVNAPPVLRTNAPVRPNAIAAAPLSVPLFIPPTAPRPATNFNYSTALIPLERWGQFIGAGPPQRLVSNGVVEYAFNSTNGVLTIPIGGKTAHWNGLEYFLGFPPELVNGHPYAHLLDIKKNLAPLLEEPARFPTNRIVVIDPGHGGMDSGTTNVYDGRFEKDFTLDWARRVQARLSASGWTVWLTRSNDVNLPLPARIAVADQHRAGLFVSLHFNSASGNRKEAGLETYCLTPTGITSDFNRGYRDDPNLVYANNRFDVENLLAAMRMHRALLNVNGHLDRGVRRARFLGVLQGQNRPAVLVEGGYLSSPMEARRIADPAYREKLAQAVAQAIMEGMRTDIRLAGQSPNVSRTAGKVN